MTKIVRLSSGEEILCNAEIEGDKVTMRDPAVIIPVGNGEIGMAPWLMYADTKDGVTIDMKFVVFVIDPADEMKSNYEQGFVPRLKGLVMPEKKLVVPDLKLAD